MKTGKIPLQTYSAKLKQKYELYENSIHLFCNELFKNYYLELEMFYSLYVEYER